MDNELDFLRMNMQTSSLLINESPMQFLPSLAGVIVEDCALFAQQLHYWLQHSENYRDGHCWVYNTIDEWNEHFFWWSSRKLQRIIAKLKCVVIGGKEYHILITKNLNDNRLNQRRWFRLDYEELHRLESVAVLERIRKKQEIFAESDTLKRNARHLLKVHPELSVDLKSMEKKMTEWLSMSKNQTPKCQIDEMEKPIEKQGMSNSQSSECQNGSLDSAKIATPECQNRDLQTATLYFPTNIQENTDTIDYYKRSLSPQAENNQGEESAKKEKCTERDLSKYLTFKKLCKEYDIPLQKRDAKRINRLIDTYSFSAIQQAIRIGGEHGARSIAYLETILTSQASEAGKGGAAHAGERQKKVQNISSSQNTDHTQMDRYTERVRSVWDKYGI